jgi:3D (Asp-Asp-Asp) domain-containing protein
MKRLNMRMPRWGRKRNYRGKLKQIDTITYYALFLFAVLLIMNRIFGNASNAEYAQTEYVQNDTPIIITPTITQPIQSVALTEWQEPPEIILTSANTQARMDRHNAAIERGDFAPVAPDPDWFVLEPSSVPSSDTPPAKGESLGYYTVYAYCNCVRCCGSWSPYHSSRIGTNYVHRTASGTIPTVGRTISADWTVLPPGTRVIINGAEYVVEDRGSGIVGNKIDMYFGDWQDGAHDRALEHGVRSVEVFLVESED